MQKFEQDYMELIKDILANGSYRGTRNAVTKSVFGRQLKIDMSTNNFPILQGRKMFHRGVFGELAALLRRPTHIDDFTKWGCNYWGLWANDDGSINVDYGNTWFDFNGVNQIAQLKDKLVNNPTDRRMIITGWKPDGMDELSLPCCHCLYQFYVSTDGKLSMLWYQRSVDTMIGLPSDILLAAAWLIAIANEFDLGLGEITMSLGDCHIYDTHVQGAYEYISREERLMTMPAPKYIHNVAKGKDFCEFEPDDISITNYYPLSKIDLELFA